MALAIPFCLCFCGFLSALHLYVDEGNVCSHTGTVCYGRTMIERNMTLDSVSVDEDMSTSVMTYQ